MMKQRSLLLTLSWLLAACAPAAVVTSTPLAAAPTFAPTLAPTMAVQPTPAVPPTAVEPTLAPSPVPATAMVIKDAFTPTDPTTVNLALGRPQFVEFYSQY